MASNSINFSSYVTVIELIDLIKVEYIQCNFFFLSICSLLNFSIFVYLSHTVVSGPHTKCNIRQREQK